MRNIKDTTRNTVGCVYVIGESEDAQFFKIGYADNIYKRLYQANHNPFVPNWLFPYILWHVDKRVYDLYIHKEIERHRHQKIDDSGDGHKTEWFHMTLPEILDLFMGLAKSKKDIRNIFRAEMEYGIIYELDAEGDYYELIDISVEKSNKANEKQHINHNIKPIYQEDYDMSEFACMLVDKLIDIPFTKTLEDYGDDLYKYESGMACFYAGQIKKIRNNLTKDNAAITLRNIENESTYADYVYALYEILKTNLNYRKQHEYICNGTPYLFDKAHNAIWYVNQNKGGE